MKTLKEALDWRYTTKVYDAGKKISAEDFAQIEHILQFSPSSTNLQPSHFIIADDDAGKARIAKAAEGPYAYNAPKIKNASHIIVFCSKVFADDEHLQAVLDQENKDGRFAEEANKTQMHNTRRMYLNIHRYNYKDEPHWHARQTYLTFGAVLLGAAQLGLDATPIEGVDIAKVDEEFGLHQKGYSALAVIALGYRDEAEDFNARLPKSRLPKERLFTKA